MANQPPPVQGWTPPGVARQQQDAQSVAAYRQWLIAQGRLMEYKVTSVRQTLIGDKVNTDELERMLNGYASQGWMVKSITETEVKGRLGPGGTSGLIIVFERLVTQ